MRVLIAEADLGLRQKMVQLLVQHGFQVDTAATGQEAVEMVRRFPYTVVVTDLAFQGMDGLEALTRIKARYPSIGSLVTATAPNEECYLRVLRSGAGDLLKKPFRGEALLSAVQAQSRKANLGVQTGATDSYRQMLVAALESLARSLDLSLVPGRPLQGMLGLGLLAAQLAQERGLDPVRCQETQLATWICAFSELPVDSPFLIDYDQFPPSLLNLLIKTEAAELSEESKLVEVVLALGRGDDLDPSKLDPDLVDFVKNRPKQIQPQEGAQRRLLLARASALDWNTQQTEATSWLEQVVKADPASREGLRAAIDLTRLSGRAEPATQAVSLAQRIGPAITADTCLEAGIVLGQQGHASAESYLQRALRFYRDGLVKHRQALTSLAQGAFGYIDLSPELLNSSISALFGGPERELPYQHLPWLGPWLSSLQNLEAHPEAVRLLGSWLRQDPHHRSQLSSAVAAAIDQLSPEDFLPPIQLRLFGHSELRRHQKRIPAHTWKSQKARWLFAYLACHPQERFSEDQLQLVLGEISLPWLVECIHGCLGQEGYLQVVERSLGLNPAQPLWIDLEQCDLSFALAQMATGQEAVQQYRRVIHLSRGPLLEDCPLEWDEEMRQRHAPKYLAALQWLAEWWHQAGRPAEALEYAQNWHEADPMQQQATVIAMDSLLALNRVEEALRWFERSKTLSEPGEALRAAQQRAIQTLTG
jgi:CheY-like chemotaxis protein/DNA-binding SARP family transcriptional activator